MGDIWRGWLILRHPSPPPLGEGMAVGIMFLIVLCRLGGGGRLFGGRWSCRRIA
jgi:hypothetical protein